MDIIEQVAKIKEINPNTTINLNMKQINVISKKKKKNDCDSDVLTNSISKVCRSLLEKGYSLQDWLNFCRQIAVIEAIDMVESKTMAAELLGVSRPHLSVLSNKKNKLIE